MSEYKNPQKQKLGLSINNIKIKEDSIFYYPFRNYESIFGKTK